MLELPYELFGWIVLSGLLGALVGLERGTDGVRTGSVVSLGSTLFTVLSIEAFSGIAGTTDPTRIAAQVVTAVGLLGAGVVVKSQNGIATATTIWIAAGIGMAVGMGMWELAVFVTLIALLLPYALQPVSKQMTQLNKARKKGSGHTH